MFCICQTTKSNERIIKMIDSENLFLLVVYEILTHHKISVDVIEENITEQDILKNEKFPNAYYLLVTDKKVKLVKKFETADIINNRYAICAETEIMWKLLPFGYEADYDQIFHRNSAESEINYSTNNIPQTKRGRKGRKGRRGKQGHNQQPRVKIGRKGRTAQTMSKKHAEEFDRLINKPNHFFLASDSEYLSQEKN